MMITRRFRRIPRFAHSRVTRRTPVEGILVVEHEFEGGPFGGRRMTGLANTDDLHVARSAAARRPRLVARAAPAECIGVYQFVRAYDCARTLERVHAYRWHPSPPPAKKAKTDQPSTDCSSTSNSTPYGSRT